MRFPRAWTTTLRALGPLNGALYLVARALARLTGERVRLVRYVFVAQPVPRSANAAHQAPAGNRARRIRLDDPIVASFPRPSQVIAQRFRDDAICLVSEVRDRFAGFIWLAFGGCDEDEVRCRYELAEPGVSAWDYDVYVAPDFRLGRTFGRLWDAANHELAARGVAWTFSRISAFNAASLAAHRRMGAEQLFVATFFCAGPVQAMLARTAPYLHISMSSSARPLIRLRPPSK